MKRKYVTLLLLAGSAAVMHGALIVSWENNHLAGNEASTVAGESGSGGSWDTNLAFAPEITRGAGATVTTYADTFAFRNGASVDLGQALTNDRYLTFTLQPSAGYELSLSNLTIRLMTQDQVTQFALMSSSLGSYAAGNEIASWSVAPPTQGLPNSYVETIDLSVFSELQGSTGAIEFRLYYWGKTSAYAQIGIGEAFSGNDEPDLVVNGTLVSAIPEPATFAAAFGFMALSLVMLRRRRRS